jgi:hypothetical protein
MSHLYVAEVRKSGWIRRTSRGYAPADWVTSRDRKIPLSRHVRFEMVEKFTKEFAIQPDAETVVRAFEDNAMDGLWRKRGVLV